MNPNVTLYNVYRHSKNVTEHKIGFTTDLTQRMSEYKRNGWSNMEVLADVKFNNAMFKIAGGVVHLIHKINGKYFKPDELIHKIITDFGYGKRVTHFDGSESEEVFQFNVDKLPNNNDSDEIRINNFLKYLSQICVANDFNYEKISVIIRSNQSEYVPYFHQSVVSAILKDKFSINNLNKVLADLPPRFGKTTWSLLDFVTSNQEVMIIAQYWLSPATSFRDEINRYRTFNNIEYYDLTDKSLTVDDLPVMVDNKKIIVVISLCGSDDRKKFNDFVKWSNTIDPNKIIRVCDEVDYGSSKDKQITKIEKISPQSKLLLMTGSGSEKVVNNWKFTSLERKNVISVEYNDLLLMQEGVHYYQDQKYLDILKQTPNENKHLIEVLERYHTVGGSQYKSYSNLIKPNYVTVKYDHLVEKINTILLENSDISSVEQSSYTKINSKPKLYSDVHKSIWTNFLGLGYMTNGLSYSNVTSQLGDDIRIFQVWTSCDNEPLLELCDVIRSIPGLTEQFQVEVVNGEFTTNKEAEEYVRNIISRLPKNKRLILLCKHMAARSFSVSQIDAQVFYTDTCNIDTAEQKSSRGKTPGQKLDLNKDGIVNTKKNCYIFHLSFTPDESITESMINNTIKKQINKGRTTEETHNIVMRTINYFILCKNAQLQKVESFTMDSLDKLKKIIDGEVEDQCKNELDSILSDFDLNTIMKFDFNLDKTQKSELKKIIDLAKSKIKMNKSTKGSSKKTVDSFNQIKQNILNYVLKSYYHVYLIYTKNNAYNNTHYKEMFKTVIKNEKHILFDNFDKSEVNSVSNIILDISNRLENDHHIYDMIDDRLKHYLSKINLKNTF